jgi:hypothetical protein
MTDVGHPKRAESKKKPNKGTKDPAVVLYMAKV